MYHLSEHGVGGTGILTINVTGKFPIKYGKIYGKVNRGSYGNRYDAANKLVVVRWDDFFKVQNPSAIEYFESYHESKKTVVSD